MLRRHTRIFTAIPGITHGSQGLQPFLSFPLCYVLFQHPHLAPASIFTLKSMNAWVTGNFGFCLTPLNDCSFKKKKNKNRRPCSKPQDHELRIQQQKHFN